MQSRYPALNNLNLWFQAVKISFKFLLLIMILTYRHWYHLSNCSPSLLFVFTGLFRLFFSASCVTGWSVLDLVSVTYIHIIRLSFCINFISLYYLNISFLLTGLLARSAYCDFFPRSFPLLAQQLTQSGAYNISI